MQLNQCTFKGQINLKCGNLSMDADPKHLPN